MYDTATRRPRRLRAAQPPTSASCRSEGEHGVDVHSNTCFRQPTRRGFSPPFPCTTRPVSHHHCVTIVLFTLPCSQTQSDATRIPSARLDRLLVSLARAHTTCTYVCNTSMVTSVTTTVTSPQSSAQHGHDRCHHLLAACVKLHGAGGNTLSKRLFPPPCTHSC